MTTSIQHVMVVRADWSVGVIAAEGSATPGLVVIADCRACNGAREPHRHRRWGICTTSGYRIGDRWLSTRREALAAAGALGALPVDWADPALAVTASPGVRIAAINVAARWGLTHDAA